MTKTYWTPNQAAVAQVETYTFTAPSAIGNTYNATLNGKVVTYTSVSGDTATTVATGLFTLLSSQTGIGPEFTEITFANPSAGVVRATAQTPGVPFANVTVAGVAGKGLVLSTGNGLANGIATVHTTANKSPSDAADPLNWLRVTAPAPGVRAIPVSGDDVVVSDTTTPILWNADHLASVQFATYARTSTFTGSIGLPLQNPGGYTEWRAPYFKFIGPAGSVPAGGITMTLGGGTGGGVPSFEAYDLGSQRATLVILGGGTINFLGVHTDNTFTLLGGATLNVATQLGEISTLSSCTVDGQATLNLGVGVTWTAASTLEVIGGRVTLGAAPATLDLNTGSQATFTVDGLTWATITAQGGCQLTWLAGGTITTLTLATGSIMNKGLDGRALTITNSTIDGDSCQVLDPLNSITWTNPTTVKQNVTTGPFTFTGPRTVRVN